MEPVNEIIRLSPIPYQDLGLKIRKPLNLRHWNPTIRHREMAFKEL